MSLAPMEMHYNMDTPIASNFGFALSSRKSKSTGMSMDMDACSILCITSVLITLAILYHVHDLCVVENKKDSNSELARRLCNIRMALVILLILEIAALVMKMRK